MSEVAVVPEINRTIAQQEHFEDYMIVYDFIWSNDVVLSFLVFQITGTDESGKPLFETDDANYSENLLEANVFLHGDIKWDGCSNWYFDEQDNVMLHFCGVKSASSLGRLMERMYDITAAKMSKFERDLADMPPLLEG
jgi:hypothetical protein